MTIQLQDVKVLDNPALFTQKFKFQITFDCVAPGVKEELEWKLVYVGSADNENNDQELDQILVGPVRVGKNRFTFEAPSPDPTLIPNTDLLDVTVILLTCSYKEQEFIRIGYYVHNEYTQSIEENSDSFTIDPAYIQRNILADKPRVTRFNINWDDAIANANHCKNKLDDQKLDEETKEKENDNEQENDDEVEDDDEDDDDDEEEEEDANFEEDLADTEDVDNKNMNDNKNCNNNSNNNNNNNNNEDDEDIDMTE